MSKKEYNLFIIWKNALNLKKSIIDDLNKKFKVRNLFYINWSSENYSRNLSRFYGTSLPDNSFKEEHCGKGEFLLIVVEDSNPNYQERITSHGKSIVNINIFDCKMLYREWSGGGHKIHATDSKEEFNHDITLLFGLNTEDFVKEYKPSTNAIKINRDLVGSNGWEDLTQMFYVLNNTNNYVVLRDFENDLGEYVQDINNYNPNMDIDILSENSTDARWILNIEKTDDEKYVTKVANNRVVFFDIKDIRDGYYSLRFGKDIIENKKKRKFYYIPIPEYHYYSCLYHALVHKFNFDTEYNDRLTFIFGEKIHNNKNNKDYYINKCSDWMKEKGYEVDIYIDNLNNFNEENIKKFDTSLIPKDLFYKHSLLVEKNNNIIITNNKEIEKLKNMNNSLNDELSKVYNSKSWKITKPLRGIRKTIKRK